MAEKNPLISVVMSTYNGQRHLRQSIASILKQTMPDFEFLIVDDCSTDKTKAILKDFCHQDQRIRIIKNQYNLGLTKSLNKAILSAKGDYIARMDDDDISLPQRLQYQYNFLQKNPCFALCGTMADVINKEGQKIGEKNLAQTNTAIKKNLLFNNQFIHSSLMIRKDVLLKEGLYNEDFKKAQDYELVLRLSAQYPLANLPQKLIRWRRSGQSISLQNKEQQKYAIKARWLAINKYGFPKIKGLFHILLRLLIFILPIRFSQKIIIFLKKYV